jgi:hypothetical protein
MISCKIFFRFNFYLFILSGSVLASADASKQAYPALKVHSDELPNSCAPVEKSKLQKSLVSKVGKNSDSDGAWRLIETLLCADDAKSNKLLLQSSLPSKIRLTASSTGEKDLVRWVKRDSELINSLMSKRQAWNATVEFASNKLTLQYVPDEACIRTRTMQFLKGKWSLISIGEACD